MSFDGSVELVWAGDARKFRLGIAELLALQERRREGVFAIARRIQMGDIYVEDIQQIIRLALLGAGGDAKVAQALVDEHVREGRLTQCSLVAHAILLNALAGDPEDPVGKAGATTEAPGATASPPPPATGTVRRSASRRKKSAR